MSVEGHIEEHFDVEVLTNPSTGAVDRELWRNTSGNLHRLGDLPAYVKYNQTTGQPTYMRWHDKEGRQHRDGDQPAIVVVSPETGSVIAESYWWHDQIHRASEKPARIDRTPSGQVILQEYYRRSKLHREDGPAVEEFCPDSGELVRAEFWRNGVQVSAPIAETHSLEP